MIKYTEYKYYLAALFSVAVWGATFVSTKVLIANSLTPAEIFLLRFAAADNGKVELPACKVGVRRRARNRRAAA